MFGTSPKAKVAAEGVFQQAGVFSELRPKGILGSQSWSLPSVALGYLGGKNIRTSEAPPVKSGDRQPERQTPVVPQRQCLRLVVYLPVQWPLPPRRGAMACPTIVAHITKTDARSF